MQIVAEISFIDLKYGMFGNCFSLGTAWMPVQKKNLGIRRPCVIVCATEGLVMSQACERRCICEKLCPGDNKVKKTNIVFSAKVKVKVKRSLTLVLFDRAS